MQQQGQLEPATPQLAAPAGVGDAQQQHKKQPKLTAADAAAILAVPEVVLLDLELLLEELDVQYVHDTAPNVQPPQQQQWQLGDAHQLQVATQGSSLHASTAAALHFRFQASLLSVGFKHGSYGSCVEAGLKDLVLQDMLDVASPAGTAHAGQLPSRPPSAAAAVGGAATEAAVAMPVALLRLLRSITIEEVQVVWRQQLGSAAVAEEVQVALDGLQVQVGTLVWQVTLS
jgi:hypothetical protein